MTFGISTGSGNAWMVFNASNGAKVQITFMNDGIRRTDTDASGTSTVTWKIQL